MTFIPTEFIRVLPYGRQTISENDVQAVVDVLQSDYLTAGPVVQRFESAFARKVGAQHAIALSSGTAGLHAAMFSAGIGPGDEVIVPAITFVATANAVLFQGGTPVFADVDPETLLVDPDDVVKKISSSTRAIVAVDYAGQPCDYDRLREIAGEFELTLIADACHSLGGMYGNRPCGSLAEINCFSLHPVKPITAGEGGVVTTCDPQIASRIRAFRNHGVETDFRHRQMAGQHFYDMAQLGFNYRLTDFQCALALSQLERLGEFTRRRQQIAARYYQLFREINSVEPLKTQLDVHHAYHLFVVRCGRHRDALFARLRDAYIGAAVHYRPVYQHSYYQQRFGNLDFACPNADQLYSEILSLPIFPAMHDYQIDQVATAIRSFESQLQSAA